MPKFKRVFLVAQGLICNALTTMPFLLHRFIFVNQSSQAISQQQAICDGFFGGDFFGSLLVSWLPLCAMATSQRDMLLLILLSAVKSFID